VLPVRLLLCALLGGASPTEPTSADDPVAAVEQAISTANDDPTSGAAVLAEALSRLQADRDRLLEDPIAREVRANAQLTLARARLAKDDEAGAHDALDDVIRTYGTEVKVDAYGPTLSELFQTRSRALADAGKGTIDVRCDQPCRVLVNELPSDGPTTEVFVGSYRVHVESTAAEGPAPLDVALDVTGPTTLHWPEPTSAAAQPPGEPADPHPADDASRQNRKRMLPRWAEAVIMVAGAAAVGAGAALIAINGRCPGREDPSDPDACPQVYTTQAPGIGVLAAGGAVLLTGGVLLTVDEVRVGRARAKSVSVGLHLRF
jgi:hypothetical protein